MTDPDVDEILGRANTAEQDGDYGAAIAWYQQAIESGSLEAEMQLERMVESLQYLLWRRKAVVIAEDAAALRACDESLVRLLDQGVGGSFALLFDQLASVRSETPDLVPNHWEQFADLAGEFERDSAALHRALEALPRETDDEPTFPGSVTEWVVSREGVSDHAAVLIAQLDSVQRDAVESYLVECVNDAEAWD